MHEDLMQKISEFLDDELSQEEAYALLTRMRDQAETAEKMRRYSMIGQVLKNDGALAARADFVSLVSQRIQQEPVYLLPNSALGQKRRHVFKRSYQFAAAAASVAVIAFVAHTQRQQDEVATPAVVAGHDSNMAVAAAEDPSAQQPEQPEAFTALRDPYPINQQINDYLQAHNASVYTNGMVDFQPYAQVTSYSQTNYSQK